MNLISITCWLMLAMTAGAVEYRVEVLKEGPPVEGLSEEVAGQLTDSGFRVIRGTSTTYCDLWLCREWPVDKDFKATAAVLYPFRPGQLIGVARFARKGADFRDQDIASGVYTLRYGQQPVDGAHVGTSPTRDFLLLVRAEDDRVKAVTDEKALSQQSAQAAGSNHPCMLSMQRLVESPKYPSIRHVEESDWWIAGLAGTAVADAARPFPVEFVIAGHAAE